MARSDPHRRLAAAVLLRAVQDVRGVKLAPGWKETPEKLRAAALAWLQSPEAAWLAEELDIDPARLVRT